MTSSKISRVSFIVFLLGVAGVFAPSVLGMDGIDGGFALAMVSGFVALVAFITWLIFWRMSVRESRILSGDGVLARFSYSDEEWQKYTAYEHATDASNKKIIFYIISGFAVFFGVLFMFLDPEEGGPYVAAVMFGLIVLMYAVMKYTTYANHRANLKSKGSAVIARDGVILNGKFSSWRGLGAQFEGVKYVESVSPKCLVFTYSMPTRGGRTDEDIRVPVPAAQEREVAGILAHFA